jgi:formamidopyrimidine-DNA glycosylase
MPELPDVTVYVEHLERRLRGAELKRVEIASPNLLRTVDPPVSEAAGRKVRGVRRVGKRIAIELEGGLFLVIHLMIAGRMRWKDAGAKGTAVRGLARFEFSTGTLSLTEAGTKHRASLHVVRGEPGLHGLDAGGIEPLSATLPEFRAALTREDHTLKRALTDPRFLAGIGNAYSDEILHRAKLSPVALTSRLTDAEVARLHAAVGDTLLEWTDRLLRDAADRFPEKVTAFRPEMAVHGKFGKPCPACGMPVQRIVYANNETNYCPKCQTGGRLLADRSLSRLLHGDWPKSLEEMEERKDAARGDGSPPAGLKARRPSGA